MVIELSARRARRRGMLMTELAVAIALLVFTVLPIAYSIGLEARTVRASYYRAVAMELVDGEMEVLAAGAHKKFGPGTHEYFIRADAVTNLPPGGFVLTVETGKLRLEWKPAAKNRGGQIVREVRL